MFTTTTTAPIEFVGRYGQDWTEGVLIDHVEAFVAAGGVVRAAASGSGARWAVVDGKAYPVVCGDIVWVDTEDGRIDGRCGRLAGPEGVCSRHGG